MDGVCLTIYEPLRQSKLGVGYQCVHKEWLQGTYFLSTPPFK